MHPKIQDAHDRWRKLYPDETPADCQCFFKAVYSFLSRDAARICLDDVGCTLKIREFDSELDFTYYTDSQCVLVSYFNKAGVLVINSHFCQAKVLRRAYINWRDIFLK